MTTDGLVKVLAVVGGGVLGGVGMGLLTQLLTKAFTTRPLPRWPALLIRLLSGVICGWLVALWLFGGGGPGIGGTGGFGFGSGSGKGEGEGERTTEIARKDNDGKKKDGEKEVSGGESLRVEVLGQNTLKETGKDTSRCYRVDTGDGPRFLTFDEVKEAIKKQQAKQPPLRRIEIVLYKDSPDERVPLVSQLRTWAADLNGGKMRVDISQPDAEAPTK